MKAKNIKAVNANTIAIIVSLIMLSNCNGSSAELTRPMIGYRFKTLTIRRNVNQADR
jgi:hypothetical protein